jgi:deferrochelatase/peroxidase EfeB
MTPPSTSRSPRRSPAVSRRGLLGALGTGAAGAALIGVGVAAGRDGSAAADGRGVAERDQVVEFHGPHQAGIATSVQSHLHFASYDVTTTDREALVDLLRDWTEAARSLTSGRQVGPGGAVDGDPLAPASDTGEAMDATAHRLTLTVGIGPTLFDDRFGLADRRPKALVDLPAFPGDTLDPARCGGDLAVQACADDPRWP